MSKEKRIYLSTMKKEDINFLVDLWYKLDVMRYADELPFLREWDKRTDKEVAWKTYREKRRIHGNDYTQLIIRLKDCTSIGESFYAPVLEDDKYYGWKKPDGQKVLMGDIKLLPSYWNKGIGTEGVREVVKFAFRNTDCDVFVVPLHVENNAALRVYEKAGFQRFVSLDDSERLLMKLNRDRYKKMYKESD